MRATAPNGIAIIVEAMTDNLNRTASQRAQLFHQGRRQPGPDRIGQPQL